MDFIIISLLIILIILCIIILIRPQNKGISEKHLEKQYKAIKQEIDSSGHKNVHSFGEIISLNQKSMNDLIAHQLETIDRNLMDKQNTSLEIFSKMNSQTEQRFNSFALENEQKLDNIRRSVELKLSAIQDDNNARLNQIQGIVDQKLQKTLDDKVSQAFALVNQRLEQVYLGLGEMQSIASGVGDLKKILSNVKSRGILGELQLGAILQEILAPSQYIENAKIKSGFVEFAVKIPTENDDVILLPIDSKFPGDTYMHLKNAVENGNIDEIDNARKNLIARFKSEAKDICTKYINPPETTDFAVMFLPFEGLYAEAVNLGMIETLQRDYHIIIAGPSTMSALLNSLRIGFQSMAIQKQSDNVWYVLNEVKKEFDKFADALEKTQTKLESANSELEKLVGTRTKLMRKQLEKVVEIDNKSNQNGV